VKIIAGLGNPGDKYSKNRHNLGFIAVDSMAKKNNLTWSMEDKFKAEICRFEDTVIVKPQVFMNNSGESISLVANYYRILPEDITIIHDDVDLSFADIRKQFNSGAAGHHGVESVILSLKTKGIWRLRVGVGRPGNGIQVEDYVLMNFNEEEIKIVENIDWGRYINFK